MKKNLYLLVVFGIFLIGKAQARLLTVDEMNDFRSVHSTPLKELEGHLKIHPAYAVIEFANQLMRDKEDYFPIGSKEKEYHANYCGWVILSALHGISFGGVSKKKKANDQETRRALFALYALGLNSSDDFTMGEGELSSSTSETLKGHFKFCQDNLDLAKRIKGPHSFRRWSVSNPVEEFAAAVNKTAMGSGKGEESPSKFGIRGEIYVKYSLNSPFSLSGDSPLMVLMAGREHSTYSMVFEQATKDREERKAREAREIEEMERIRREEEDRRRRIEEQRQREAEQSWAEESRRRAHLSPSLSPFDKSYEVAKNRLTKKPLFLTLTALKAYRINLELFQAIATVSDTFTDKESLVTNIIDPFRDSINLSYLEKRRRYPELMGINWVSDINLLKKWCLFVALWVKEDLKEFLEHDDFSNPRVKKAVKTEIMSFYKVVHPDKASTPGAFEFDESLVHILQQIKETCNAIGYAER